AAGQDEIGAAGQQLAHGGRGPRAVRLDVADAEQAGAEPGQAVADAGLEAGARAGVQLLADDHAHGVEQEGGHVDDRRVLARDALDLADGRLFHHQRRDLRRSHLVALVHHLADVPGVHRDVLHAVHVPERGGLDAQDAAVARQEAEAALVGAFQGDAWAGHGDRDAPRRLVLGHVAGLDREQVDFLAGQVAQAAHVVVGEGATLEQHAAAPPAGASHVVTEHLAGRLGERWAVRAYGYQLHGHPRIARSARAGQGQSGAWTVRGGRRGATNPSRTPGTRDAAAVSG